MPLFTKFKKAKDAATEHKKTIAAEQVKAPAPPYKHVPTHAKEDALATQPTTLRPEELQARIAAARKRRAVSWQSTIPSRHSVYHSCESSRASSRANSIANFPAGSIPPSLRGRGSSAESIDAILRRPHSASNTQSYPMANGRVQPYDLPFTALGMPSGLPLPPLQRPRNVKPKSRRSSFTKKRSPLSSVSVEEEPDELFSSSSNTSAVSTQSSATNDSQRTDSTSSKVLEDVTPTDLPRSSMQTSATQGPQPPSNVPLVRSRPRWALFQRKSIDITAH